MMMKPQITQLSHSTKTPFLLHKPFIHGNGNGNASVLLPIISRHSFQKKKKNVGVGFIPTSNNIKAVASTTENEKATSVEAIVTVKITVGGFLSNLGIDRGLDDIKDLLGKTLLLELVSAELDPSKYCFTTHQQFFFFFLFL
jgi:lipoxygenase